MVDPTYTKNCPACGYEASANQMGQIYGHRGVNGCPYSGTTPLERKGIHPLPFAVEPAVKVAVAAERGRLVATARHGLDHDLVEGDVLSLRDYDDTPFGVGEVSAVETVKLNRVRSVTSRYEAVYSRRRKPSLLERMNGYYDDDLDWGTEVDVVVFDPELTHF